MTASDDARGALLPKVERGGGPPITVHPDRESHEDEQEQEKKLFEGHEILICNVVVDEFCARRLVPLGAYTDTSHQPKDLSTFRLAVY
jgi:hypothetical protein